MIFVRYYECYWHSFIYDVVEREKGVCIVLLEVKM